jgi:ABC-type lipoprotein export system ATPase subunit
LTSPGASGAAVEVDHVAKTYGGRIRALRDVSLRVAPGEVVALTGPSGCGKSTLLNVIAAIERPDSGRVLVDGVCVTDLERPVAYRRDTFGFVFQLHHLLPMLTARANVELPLIAAGVPRAERRRRALGLLSEVGLLPRAEERPATLSGGERQRVAVARALVNEPRLLLADEPTGSLDSESGRLVLAVLDRARARRGMTLLTASHDPVLGDRADRVVRMADGAILGEEGSEATQQLGRRPPGDAPSGIDPAEHADRQPDQEPAPHAPGRHHRVDQGSGREQADEEPAERDAEPDAERGPDQTHRGALADDQ